ncbi:hypothetical protein BH09PSE4_BH09PSE4_18940 [soil metagenome]
MDATWEQHCGDRWRLAVLTATTHDICAIVGPSPRRAGELAAMMRRLGVGDLSGLVSTVHGPSVSPRLARRGDVVRKGWALGICRGELAEYFGGMMLPIGEADEAWPIASWPG